MDTVAQAQQLMQDIHAESMLEVKFTVDLIAKYLMNSDVPHAVVERSPSNA